VTYPADIQEDEPTAEGMLREVYTTLNLRFDRNDKMRWDVMRWNEMVMM